LTLSNALKTLRIADEHTPSLLPLLRVYSYPVGNSRKGYGVALPCRDEKGAFYVLTKFHGNIFEELRILDEYEPVRLDIDD